MFEDLVGTKVKIVFQDGSNVIVFFGKINAVNEGFVVLETESNVKYLSWKNIIKMEEVLNYE